MKLISNGKLISIRGNKEPEFKKMLFVTIQNTLFSFILTYSLMYSVIEYAPGWFYRNPENESLPRTFLMTLLMVILLDLFFYPGHYLFHKTSFKFHDLHHTSRATCSISGFYMTLPDFLGEYGPAYVLLPL